MKEVKNFNFANADISIINASFILNPIRGFNEGYDFTLNLCQSCQYQCDYCYTAAFTLTKEKWEDWLIANSKAKLITLLPNSVEIMKGKKVLATYKTLSHP